MKVPGKLLKRNKDSNKYDYGYVMVVGGARGMVGAPWLSAGAALKIGAGLVRLALPESLKDRYRQKEIMTLPLADKSGCLCPAAYTKLKQSLAKVSVMVVGPGASRETTTQKLLSKVVQTIDIPMVIDADCLNIIAQNDAILQQRKSRDIVLTPHLGEFSRLLGKDKKSILNKRKELVKEYALRYNLTLVLKGDSTLISDGTSIFENKTGNPGLAKAGTGDVLAGMIAGLMAQGLNGFTAARLGVYLHGLAADIAVKDKTQMCLIAGDIIDYLPAAIKAAR